LIVRWGRYPGPRDVRPVGGGREFPARDRRSRECNPRQPGPVVVRGLQELRLPLLADACRREFFPRRGRARPCQHSAPGPSPYIFRQNASGDCRHNAVGDDEESPAGRALVREMLRRSQFVMDKALVRRKKFRRLKGLIRIGSYGEMMCFHRRTCNTRFLFDRSRRRSSEASTIATRSIKRRYSSQAPFFGSSCEKPENHKVKEETTLSSRLGLEGSGPLGELVEVRLGLTSGFWTLVASGARG
jgi:hypothetical protein